MQQDIHSQQQEVQPAPLTRLEANKKILRLLDDYIYKYPDMRFGQMLYNLNIATHLLTNSSLSEETIYRDIFFEESSDLLFRVTEQQEK